MSYIEKEKLIKADMASIENRVRHAFNQGYDLGFKDGKERAKPLKQEPVIDKIRSEIEAYANQTTDEKQRIAFNACLNLIDHYTELKPN